MLAQLRSVTGPSLTSSCCCSTSTPAAALRHRYNAPARLRSQHPRRRAATDTQAVAGHRSGDIVVAIDDTQAAWSSVRWALQNLYKEGMTLRLLHVVPKDPLTHPMPVSAAYGAWNSSMECENELEGRAHQFIQEALGLISKDFDARCEIDIVRASSRKHIGASICERAEAIGAVVVVVTHQRRGLMQTLLAQHSVADYVAKHCKQPVLVYQQGSYNIGSLGGSAVQAGNAQSSREI